MEIYTDPSQNAIVLNIPNGGAVFSTGDFKYKYAPGPGFTSVAKGSAVVTFEDVQIRIGLKFRTADKSDGRSIMQVDAVDVYVNINRRDLDFDFRWDGISGDVISIVEMAIIPIFKGLIVDAIANGIEDAIYAITPLLNDALWA